LLPFRLVLIFTLPLSLMADDLSSKLIQRGRELMLDGQFSNSLPYLEKLHRREPHHEKTGYYLALALIYQEKPVSKKAYREDLQRAVALLARSIEQYSRISDRGEELGLRYFYQGLAYWYGQDALKALHAFRAAYRADFERLDAVYNQFSILEELGKWEEADLARNHYRRLLKSSSIDD